MLTPMKAIRAYCLDCSNGSAQEVKRCEIRTCPLHRLRFGRNPNRQKRLLTNEQRDAMVSRMNLARGAKSLIK
jgi:hypothetical protein